MVRAEMTQKLLSPCELQELLHYDPENGRLFWRDGSGEAFTSVDTKGYRRGTILGRRIRAHRVIWALVHGEWPEQIDHINGDRQDNRLRNLRNVLSCENQRNMRRPSNNTSGIIGVSFFTASRRWRAHISFGGVQHHLGYFATKEEAAEARRRAEREFGYHPNHGRIAPNA